MTSQERKRRKAVKAGRLVSCEIHGLSAAGGGKCLRCAREAAAIRREVSVPAPDSLRVLGYQPEETD